MWELVCSKLGLHFVKLIPYQSFQSIRRSHVRKLGLVSALQLADAYLFQTAGDAELVLLVRSLFFTRKHIRSYCAAQTAANRKRSKSEQSYTKFVLLQSATITRWRSRLRSNALLRKSRGCDGASETLSDLRIAQWRNLIATLPVRLRMRRDCVQIGITCYSRAILRHLRIRASRTGQWSTTNLNFLNNL